MPAPKPTSAKTDLERKNAWDEYRAEHEAQLERMAHLRALRLEHERQKAS